MIIAKVIENKLNKQKIVTIPLKNTEIKEGDYVKIKKIKEIK